MKKIYTFSALTIGLLVGLSAVGQESQREFEKIKTKQNTQERPLFDDMTQAGDRDEVVIYYEDFAGGLPNDWEEFTESGPCSWEWTDEGHQGDFPSAPLQSTTADNGWMILDSDNCGTSGGDTEVAYLVSPSVDLSAYSDVSFRFEQNYRRYTDVEVTSVEVSIDGGNEWTTYTYNEDIGSSGTPNPHIPLTSISELAGGESDVRFRFSWVGVWGYGWQVDDFTVYVPNDNDLALLEFGYGNFDPEAEEVVWENLEYSVYDLNQVRPLFFNGHIQNVGLNEQTGVQLEVIISDSDGVIETVSSDPITVAQNEEIQIELPPYTPPAEVGEYMIEFNVLQDAEDDNLENNSGAKTFQIADGIFARDNGVLQNSGPANVENDEVQVGGGNGFYFSAADEIHCLGAALAEDSDPNIFFTGYIRELAEGNAEAETQPTTIEDMGATLNAPGGDEFTWLDLFTPFEVFDGDEYFVTFEYFAEVDGGEIFIGISGESPDISSYVWGPTTTTGTVCEPCQTPSTYMVRVGLSEEFCNTVSIEEADQITMHELYPNPSQGQTTLEYSLLETSDVQLMLFDQQGRIVMQENKGTQPVGEYRFDYDFSHLANGMYTFSIQTGGKAINKKLVIK